MNLKYVIGHTFTQGKQKAVIASVDYTGIRRTRETVGGSVPFVHEPQDQRDL